MSQHWQPPKSKVVGIRPVAGKRLRSLDEFVRPDFGRRQHALSSGAKAGLVIMGAACLGVGIGAYQALGPRETVASEAKPSRAATIAPVAVPDPSDEAWKARSRSPGIPAENDAYAGDAQGSYSAPSAAVRASFSYCKWGGGTNCVVDGDTIYLNGAKVRIAGIDAPETHDYRCQSELELGERAARQLQALLNSGAVTMTSIDRDRDVYGRLLRNVSVDGRDVGETLISAGLARPYAGGRKPWC